jgi:tetratricopeptide (TPR) repeat protein
MTRIVRNTALTTIGMVLIVAVPLLQGHLDQQRAATPKLQGFLYLPQGEYLRIAVLGYEQMAADFLWIQAIQAMGERKISEESGAWLARTLNVITTLDPRFGLVYEVGGIALTTLVHLPEESNRLLEKGIINNPQVWKLPFLLGFNYYFDFSDDLKAAEYIARASRLPGAPEYLPRLAARLFVSAKTPQIAIDFLAQVYAQTTDENVKRVLEQRLKEAVVERDLLLLEEAIGRYRQTVRSPPEDLRDLVRKGILRELPTEPFGGRYLYDPQTQTVRSSEVKERMKVYRRGMPR